MSSSNYNNSSVISVGTVVTVNDGQDVPYMMQVAIIIAVCVIGGLVLLACIFAILYCIGCFRRSPFEERTGSCCRRTPTSSVYVLEELENGYYQLTNKKMQDTIQRKHGPIRVVNSPDDTVILEKKVRPAKEVHTWMPHTNHVREINTSTK